MFDQIIFILLYILHFLIHSFRAIKSNLKIPKFFSFRQNFRTILNLQKKLILINNLSKYIIKINNLSLFLFFLI